ncbi:MAG: aldehyde dehydrogenase family protein, partial [Leptospiraceae bacterium]|nr:aldehyde dehydrogenase family protein [Leptospiraceae bacterium]
MDTIKQNISSVFELQSKRKHFLKTISIETRIEKLKKLKEVILHNSGNIEKAHLDDFGKPPQETQLSEIAPVISEINEMERNLKSWARVKSVGFPITLIGSVSEVRYEPKGAILVISPWNYPFQLAMVPLVGAVGAGNTVILKPSELTPNVSSLLKRIIEEVFPIDEVAVFNGGQEVAELLTELPFDHIFFTGSTRVGKIIMEKAAKNLSSVTLELGGKSPVIIDPDSDLKTAAERIAWGKFLNAGQTCIAPDYVLLPSSYHDKFSEYMRESLLSFYSSKGSAIEESTDYTRIINDASFDRINSYIEDAISKGASIGFGGNKNKEKLYIEPTILKNVTTDSLVMKEEIFGPILPLVDTKDLESSIDFINARPKPLALYIFCSNDSFSEKILNRTSSGGVVVNDTLIHFINHHLPFGGVNHSGIGNYHGQYSFKAFSHEKAVLKQGIFSSMKFLYPPYNYTVEKITEFMKNF